MRHFSKALTLGFGALGLVGLSLAAACSDDDVGANVTPDASTDTGVGPGEMDAADSALPPVSGVTVDETQFLGADQLQQWQVDLDNRGLRATGSVAHEGYVDELMARLSAAGVPQLHFENVPLTRWSVDSWSLEVTSGGNPGAVETASYIPYSGQTPTEGETAPLVAYSEAAATGGQLAGKIVLFQVPKAPVTLGVFQALSLRTYDPAQTVSPSTPYDRSYMAIGALTALLEKLQAAGAAGAIGVLDAPAVTAHGTYFPYDRKIRQVPSLFVDRVVGARLAAEIGSQVKLTLPAKVETVQTRNLIGMIPGATDELTVVNSHTDGTNGIEDNGPNAIVGIAKYLSRVPKAELPRSIMILLSSGHFAGGAGAEAFLAAHRDDGLTARIASILTIEHMGAQEWLPDDSGVLAPTGKPEPSAIFMPNVTPLVDAAYAALERADAAPSFVMPPLNPNADGAADTAAWPGEGQYFWAQGQITTANYITGPTYLLNWGITTADKVDYARMRREAVSFTQMLLDLSRIPASSLR
ncbi:PA domain protein [Labilithrix luteola]|uniref:PA domain protein n=1 Tax=Labilithrix luteola TaxID=1391654 RepID=UPI003B833007